MNFTFICLLIIAAFVAFGLWYFRALPHAHIGIYYKRPVLLSPAERSFLGVLEMIELPGTRFVTKVRLADVFDVDRGVSRSSRTRALNLITSKHIDFLLVRSCDFVPLLAIELDDRSHLNRERMSRDAFVETLFTRTNLPLLRFSAKVSYNQKVLAQYILEQLPSLTPKIAD